MLILKTIRFVFCRNRKVNLLYISLFLFFNIAFIFFFIELQVLLTPEPDNLYLYLKIWRIKDWLIVGILSILVSLNFVFFVYLVKIKNNYPNNRPNKLSESSDRIKTILIKRLSNYIYPNEEPNKIKFGNNSDNLFCKNSDSKNIFDPNSGKVFGQYSGRDIIFGHNSGKNIFIGILGILSGIFSAILATALCSSCLAVLFSLLGISFSTGIFFLKYKFLIFLLSTILLLISLHFQSKRIIEKCRC